MIPPLDFNRRIIRNFGQFFHAESYVTATTGATPSSHALRVLVVVGLLPPLSTVTSVVVSYQHTTIPTVHHLLTPSPVRQDVCT